MMLLLTGTASFAQIRPTRQIAKAVTNEGMVINDRGSKLEVFPSLRAIRTMTASGSVHSEFMSGKIDPINPQQLGVVFNHAMQVRGYFTGEIAIKMKDGLQAADWLDRSSFPGLAKLTEPNIYIVVARNPLEFVELTKQLQERIDMEWVEPIVVYGPGYQLH